MKGYRTIIWTAANAVVPAMAAVSSSYQIPEEWMPYWIGVYMVGNVILRIKTTTALGSAK